MAICLSAVGGLTSINNLKLKQGGFYEKEMRLNIMIVLIVVCLTMLTACMKGAPDDAYMIDLTSERDVVIENSIEYVAMGDFDSFELYEQLLLEEYGDAFNSEIHNIGSVEKVTRKEPLKQPNIS